MADSEWEMVNRDGAPSERTHYRVYLVTYLCTKETHHAICVETDPEQRFSSWGHLFRVDGDLYNGMRYDFDKCCHPFESSTGQTMEHIGWVRREASVKEVCEGIPAPPKQWGDKLKQIDPDVPPRHSHHWAADVVTALKTTGVLEPLLDTDDGRVIVRPKLVVDKKQPARVSELRFLI
ncbi:uncharacterized protein B0H64DRAFT_427961 [Chaetomium fimeti]|uniref:Uncharacterized protein n=1 Tax=Chaetomium fimeti TaxID=1854472 RepID=A0AAE0LW49_9PEZI|nr:hypothetical protein B0H64DRAFT_427961 [Chaetomium fimeti]